ncbi:hypothetical protein BU24DRAFT_418072 [Aaosphaeria arxii CBS 175.79]|uniref:Rhodopsin domain-containing protein n=1 Tax=Aaosphaeria arxii CBS 175.79 TaxID=1450172 RepID=A0A6A5XZX2_9PLEO|nr:uncharacterized protein BU24DRAFT_418072 [Aaosphaeria arxii CBS 175.79]KAF2018549.1 hypothetical protein BU24DRAFT_418072 [Aaosphaeria arxii CBS 175.79]
MWSIRSDNVQGRVMMGVDIAFLVLAFVSFAIRLKARKITRMRLDGSDYTCFAGLILSVGLTVILFAVFSHGWGLDVSHFTEEYQVFAGKLMPSIIIVWNTAVTCVRVSMLLFYLRIFEVSSLRPAFWIALGLNIAGCVAICITALTICRPMNSAYKQVPGGHCGDILVFQSFTAYWNLIGDVAIVILPMPILWSLKIGTRKKIGLSIIMGLGVIICIGTIIRVIFSAVYMVGNITMQNAVVVFITAMEPVLGVIIACVAHFPPVFRRFGSSHFAISVSRIFRSEKSTGNGADSTWSGSTQHSAPSNQGEFDFDLDSTRRLNLSNSNDQDSKYGIKVTNEWDVERASYQS